MLTESTQDKPSLDGYLAWSSGDRYTASDGRATRLPSTSLEEGGGPCDAEIALPLEAGTGVRASRDEVKTGLTANITVAPIVPYGLSFKVGLVALNADPGDSILPSTPVRQRNLTGITELAVDVVDYVGGIYVIVTSSCQSGLEEPEAQTRGGNGAVRKGEGH